MKFSIIVNRTGDDDVYFFMSIRGLLKNYEPLVRGVQ